VARTLINPETDTMHTTELYEFFEDDQPLGTVKVLKPRIAHDMGIDGKIQVSRVIAPTHLKARDLTRAIERRWTYTYCQHEHDCCGCPTHFANARRLSSREYFVEIVTTFNC